MSWFLWWYTEVESKRLDLIPSGVCHRRIWTWFVALLLSLWWNDRCYINEYEYGCLGDVFVSRWICAWWNFYDKISCFECAPLYNSMFVVSFFLNIYNLRFCIFYLFLFDNRPRRTFFGCLGPVSRGREFSFFHLTLVWFCAKAITDSARGGLIFVV